MVAKIFKKKFPTLFEICNLFTVFIFFYEKRIPVLITYHAIQKDDIIFISEVI